MIAHTALFRHASVGMGHIPGDLSHDNAHSRMLWVLVVSLGLHLLAYGGLIWGKFLDPLSPAEKKTEREFVISVTLAPVLQSPTEVIPTPPRKPRLKPKTLVEVPLDRATPEKPKNSKFYSDKNAKAANINPPKKTQAQPKLEGTQYIVPKLENTPKPLPKLPRPKQRPKVAKPNLPNRSTPTKSKPTKPKAIRPVKVAKVNPLPPTQPPAKPVPPTPKSGPTLEQALKALPKNQSIIPGRLLKHDGGVAPVGKPSFDVQLTGYGSYDLKLTAAISRRWHQLLEIHNGAPGQVVIEFDLFANGNVRNVRLISNTVGPLHTFVCEHALTDPAPFDVWSMTMRQEIKTGRKHCRITFSYIPR